MPRPPVTPSLRLLRIDEMDAAAALFRRAMLTVPCFDPALHTAEEDQAYWHGHVFGRGEIIGAFADGALRGQIALSPGWNDQLHVDPDWQGHGIGLALLDAAKARMPDIQLWTFQANAGARRFYERGGFVAVELTDGAGNEERLPDMRYRWRR